MFLGHRMVGPIAPELNSTVCNPPYKGSGKVIDLISKKLLATLVIPLRQVVLAQL